MDGVVSNFRKQTKNCEHQAKLKRVEAILFYMSDFLILIHLIVRSDLYLYKQNGEVPWVPLSPANPWAGGRDALVTNLSTRHWKEERGRKQKIN